MSHHRGRVAPAGDGWRPGPPVSAEAAGRRRAETGAADAGAPTGTSDDPVGLVIGGGGPRAIAVIERLSAGLSADEQLRVVMIGAVELGAGATWRTDQPPVFLNNTSA